MKKSKLFLYIFATAFIIGLILLYRTYRFKVLSVDKQMEELSGFEFDKNGKLCGFPKVVIHIPHAAEFISKSNTCSENKNLCRLTSAALSPKGDKLCCSVRVNSLYLKIG